MKSKPRANIRSIPEILELEREFGDGFFDQLYGFLQSIAFRPRNTHRIPLYAALHLEFAILDEPDDLFGQVAFNPCFNRDLLFDLVSADFFYLSLIQAPYVNITFGKLGHKNVQYLPQLEFIVRKNGQGIIRLLHARIRSFEIEARADFL